ncbi:RNA polymerase sigma factor [Gelidibacter salicanalis]|uniref:RNA polymerase sigma-70 factor n=1 Tax=Gelidibacter salicanalis TaxID=291193 RepID=A0A934KQW6_9FLAO|nr:RNA polymerase sigma-70 factor [Gelidibacter salicanalis]MBJ7881859.1 RNA polymerase sigma-70 factor [Gelidibacter salicanalis]
MSSKLSLKERDLIHRLNNNDESALASVYKEHWELMYFAVYNLVNNKQISEDIVQDVFVKIWRNRERLDIKVSLKSYLYTSAIYKTYDYFRKNKSAITVDLLENFNERIQTSNPETKLMDKELHEYLETIISELPEKCRIVFNLSRNEDLSHKEIASKLNISPRTVEGHITKALKILRGSLSSISTTSYIIFILYHYHN